MNKKLLAMITFITAMICISVIPTRAENPEIDPPDEIGPYQVGYFNLQLIDTSRNQEMGGRPVVVDVFYPIDSYNNGQPLLPAEYVSDPFGVLGMNKKGYSTLSSTLWEGYGIDPVYQAPVPSPDGPFPLVVFSPGFDTPGYGFIFVGARLASHGFVVATLTDYGDFYYEHSAWTLINRTADFSFALTDLLARDLDPADLLYGMINEDQIAASGHSMGGYTAMALAGGDSSACDIFDDPLIYDPLEGLPPPETCVPIYPDARIKVIVTLDSANQFLHFSELTQITLPAMGIGEEWDMCAADTSWPLLPATTWQARSHLAILGQPNYRVEITGAVHRSFTNMCEAVEIGHDIGYFNKKEYQAFKCTEGPISQTEIERLTTMYMLAFLKVNLVGESGYQPFLTPGYALLNEPSIEFYETEKGDPRTITVDWPDFSLYFDHQPGR